MEVINEVELSDEEAVLARKYIDKIVNGTTLEDIIGTWNLLMADPRSESGNRIMFAVHRSVVDRVVEVATGKDPNFTHEEVMEFLEKRNKAAHEARYPGFPYRYPITPYNLK